MLAHLKHFKKATLLGLAIAVLFALIETGVLGPDYYTFVVVGLLAFGVVLVYEAVIYIFHRTT